MAYAYKTIQTTVDVEIDIDDFDTEDLIEALEGKGYTVIETTKTDKNTDLTELVADMYQKRRTGQDYTSNIDELIYQVIGRI